MMRPSALAPQVVQPPPQPPQPQVVYVQQKSGGGIVSGTIKAAGFIVSVIFLLVLGTCVYVCGSAANEVHKSSASLHEDNATTPTPTPMSPPREQDPVYDIAEVEHAFDVRQAMESVYSECRKFAAWREGTELEGTYVEASRKAGHGALVNVGVKLARPQLVNGNTLWYQVDLDKRGRPTKITPTKSVGQGLCAVE
jgi:hypothetical protein